MKKNEKSKNCSTFAGENILVVVWIPTFNMQRLLLPIVGVEFLRLCGSDHPAEA
jgi:hypothetical protein